ncbi:MAG: MEKHLA domain-containing protein, partial [Gammaproteobacteria bacterium]
MITHLTEPAPANHFLQEHAHLLLSSLRHWTGRDVIDPTLSLEQQAQQLFHASFAVASHDASADPVLNYGNRAALQLWEASWPEFVSMPSRFTAETITQDERRRLLAEVITQGFIDNYQGIRISAKGRRFMIKQATVWNLLNEADEYCGQAVIFRDWH